ncbi:uncharacterized protein EI97DRAFT_437480 [Westerdykella ornata]|uniref:Uncharacterized protein n=1 Tax=Westerdykella ornata TaxID=318751 RepID=A0A6A6J714_WESOR|nr:uncharacterized protein EI97DRAFT_437480 [Westerdykella ornata]KAF2271788.1 hypothetical protein EI97DRAFT_437480 [Westerdykella ornata]
MPADAVAHSPSHFEKQNQPSTSASAPASAQPDSSRPTSTNAPSEYIRLHITPFSPALLKVYLAPSVLPLARNISYHVVETFPERGFGYVDLPVMEAQKVKKKLNGSTLKGSKVKIENAKPEKRKALAEADAAEKEKPAKRVKKEKSRRKKEQGVLEGVELPEGRKVKRGWTETAAEKKKAKKERKDKKEKKAARKESKYTKEPELLFHAKLTPVAANELLHKEKKKENKEKKEKKKKKNPREVVIHEFEHNTKTPSFLKTSQVAPDPKPAVEYINGKGWVDEDGNVVEAETGKARNRRLLELVEPAPAADNPTQPTGIASSPKSKTKPEKKKSKKKQVTPTPLPSSSESSDDDAESSVVSSSSDEEESSSSDSDSESSVDDASSTRASPTANTSTLPDLTLTASSPPATSTPKPEPQKDQTKQVHPLEALFKRPKPPTLSPAANTTTSSTPGKTLAPIKTAFSFFDNDGDGDAQGEGDATTAKPPMTPFTQRDLEWRGLRSAAPTPDTAAIGRKFSFDWRREGSAESDDEDDGDGDEEGDEEMRGNTVANMHLDDDGDEDARDANADADADGVKGGEQGEGEGQAEESAFGKWFWEARGDSNRAWKKRRRETLKAKRLRENRRLTGGRKV